MLVDLLLLAAFGALGLWLQRRPRGDLVRTRLWAVNYAVLIPIAAAFAFLTVDLDAHLAAIVACTVTAWWITVALAGAYGHLVARERPMAGALWLVAAFPNTGFIGFPLAHLAFGADGLRLAIIYDQVSLVIPAIVVSTIIAQRHAATSTSGVAHPSAWRTVLTSPPVWSVLVLLVLRATVVREPLELDALGGAVGAVVGPVGFLLLGLSLPRGEFSHGRREVAEVLGAISVRIIAAPLLVWLVAHAAGVDMPDVLYLVAALPTAFHALVISRLYGLEVTVVRLGVLASSVGVVTVTVVWVALGGGG
ncbi:MAG: transporter [Thermoleophilia bacterium]|nr:transporter [Thermoleophilia bacterium]